MSMERINFHKFKEALLQAALEKYCHLEVSIERGSYYMPTYQPPDFSLYGTLTAHQQEKLQDESIE